MGGSTALYAGVARADITPPVGIDLGGFYTRTGPSTHVLDPLTATALLLRVGGTSLLIVACDVLSFRGELGIQVREFIARAVSMAAMHVMPAASHTHSGPALGTHLRTSLHTGQALPYAYRENLLHTLAGLALEAKHNVQPARLAVGEGMSTIGVNRRECVAGGRIVIGMNEEGVADRSVGVLRVDAISGGTLAIVVNYTCHPIVLGPKSRAISADYPGAMRRIVEDTAGAPCLFVQGACGDAGPVCGEDAGPPGVRRLGSILGHEVSRVFWSLDPRPVDRRKVIFESVAPLTNLIESSLPEPPHMLDVVERSVDLPLLEPPSLEEVRRWSAQLSGTARSDVASKSDQIELAKIEVQQAWCTYLMELYENGVVPQSVAVTVVALRIDDLGVVALPLEPFAGIGLDIKLGSPAAATWVVGYAHGCAGYVPSPGAYAEGGYEVETSYKLYRLPAPFAPKSYELLVDTGRALLAELFPESRREGVKT